MIVELRRSPGTDALLGLKESLDFASGAWSTLFCRMGGATLLSQVRVVLCLCCAVPVLCCACAVLWLAAVVAACAVRSWGLLCLLLLNLIGSLSDPHSRPNNRSPTPIPNPPKPQLPKTHPKHPPTPQALAQHVSRFSGPSGPPTDDARESLSAALQCCHALMTRGGMDHLLAAPSFLRYLAASLAADVAVTGSDEARLALEMLTKTLLYSPDAYMLTLQALLGLPFRRLPRKKRRRGAQVQAPQQPESGVGAEGGGGRWEAPRQVGSPRRLSAASDAPMTAAAAAEAAGSPTAAGSSSELTSPSASPGKPVSKPAAAAATAGGAGSQTLTAHAIDEGSDAGSDDDGGDNSSSRNHSPAKPAAVAAAAAGGVDERGRNGDAVRITAASPSQEVDNELSKQQQPEGQQGDPRSRSGDQIAAAGGEAYESYDSMPQGEGEGEGPFVAYVASLVQLLEVDSPSQLDAELVGGLVGWLVG